MPLSHGMSDVDARMFRSELLKSAAKKKLLTLPNASSDTSIWQDKKKNRYRMIPRKVFNMRLMWPSFEPLWWMAFSSKAARSVLPSKCCQRRLQAGDVLDAGTAEADLPYGIIEISIFPQIAGSYRGSYFSKVGLLITEIAAAPSLPSSFVSLHSPDSWKL